MQAHIIINLRERRKIDIDAASYMPCIQQMKLTQHLITDFISLNEMQDNTTALQYIIT